MASRPTTSTAPSFCITRTSRSRPTHPWRPPRGRAAADVPRLLLHLPQAQAPQPPQRRLPAHRPAGAQQQALRHRQDRWHQALRESYNRQFCCRYVSTPCRPTSTAPTTTTTCRAATFRPPSSRKAHEAKQRSDAELVVWGNGTPLREFSTSMTLPTPPSTSWKPADDILTNVGVRSDVTIRQLTPKPSVRWSASPANWCSIPPNPTAP